VERGGDETREVIPGEESALRARGKAGEEPSAEEKRKKIKKKKELKKKNKKKRKKK
jgi:hypothetical protein